MVAATAAAASFRCCSAQAGQYFLAARLLLLSLTGDSAAVTQITPVGVYSRGWNGFPESEMLPELAQASHPVPGPAAFSWTLAATSHFVLHPRHKLHHPLQSGFRLVTMR